MDLEGQEDLEHRDLGRAIQHADPEGRRIASRIPLGHIEDQTINWSFGRLVLWKMDSKCIFFVFWGGLGGLGWVLWAS